MTGAAMHDAVAASRQPIVPQMRVAERQQCVERSIERRRRACRPALFGQNSAAGIAGKQMRHPGSRSRHAP